MMTRRYRVRTAMITAGVLALVLAVTLRPTTAPPMAFTLCLICGERGGADALANLLLFVPVGLVFRLYLSPSRVVYSSMLLSAAIEVAQLWLPGRYASAGDVLFNTLGASAAVAVVAAWPFVARPPRRRAFTLAVLWFVLAATILIGGRVLLEPAPPDTIWYGQWTPRFGDLAAYRGRVLDARLGQVPLASRRLLASASAAGRASMAAGAPLRVRFVAGPTPPSVAPIFSVGDERQQRVLLLAADGADLVYGYRQRGALLRLNQPRVRIRNAFADIEPGRQVEVVVRPAAGARVRFEVEGRSFASVLGVVDTWRLLVSPTFLGRHPRLRLLVSIFWIVVLAGPAVWWLVLGFRAGANPTVIPGGTARDGFLH